MASILPFKEIFRNKIFRIPDYQRGYSWEQSQLDDLWADLTNIHIANDAFHFTGIVTINNFSEQDFKSLDKEGFSHLINRDDNTILINGETYDPCNLVDGQQRLTTILILLSQLVKRLRDPAERLKYSRQYFYMHDDKNRYLFGYHVDVPSHNYLIHDIFEDDDYQPELTETLYTHNLDFAKNYFNQKLEEYNETNCRDLISKVTDRLLFSVLNLSEAAGSNLDISMVFETLNFRGKQLSGLERFKNRVLYLLSKQSLSQTRISSTRKDINKTWLEIYKWLGRNPDPKKVMDDDAFLKAFWLLYFSNETMVAKDFKAYQKNLFEKDFSLQNIHGNHFMKPSETQSWLKNMRRAIVLWYFINNPYEVEKDPEFKYYYTPAIQRSLLRLNSFPFGYGRYMLNLVLAVLVRLLPKCQDGLALTPQQELDVENIEKFLWAAERHNIMCFLFHGNKTNFNQEATFRDVNCFFKTGRAANSNASLTELLLNSRVSHFSWDLVNRNLADGLYFYNWDGIHFVLKEYEEHISGDIIQKEISVNKIYPESSPSVRILYPEINRFGVNKKRKYSYALGNLFMSNNNHGDRDFASHKTRIETAIGRNNLIYESEKQLLDIKSWNTQDIESRSRNILNVFVEKWNLPNPGENFWKDYFEN
ncbi:DUF262 domain-containing protein [Chryseobacterium arthrosphaerae]|uniref:DUF262 domain-containing protein n=1 Tax=Chryseobacterium TaxID=59732 RepID=UPI000810F01E|nr:MULTISPECIES: DUF262 domain-containing protein [Chryseobacterium]OCK51061.1 hypothetical protein BA768_18325 [Chryseobacterium sp. CBo1]UEQ78055.1 DUF262 domain-containing protein [Chryseobacterium arthrosphaerae]VXC33250.1 conserved hypothetical protein [Chryseobacterium sp. 8AT]